MSYPGIHREGSVYSVAQKKFHVFSTSAEKSAAPVAGSEIDTAGGP